MKKKINQLGITQKLGMSRFFNQKGESTPVTILKFSPAYILSVNRGKGLVEIVFHSKKQVKKSLKTRLKKAGISQNLTQIVSFKIDDNFKLKEGDKLDIQQFQIGDQLTVVSRSKGKGFSGVIKKYSFSRGPETHGSHHHRATGSIGSMFPQRVIAGKKMPGRLGGQKRTIKNLAVADIDKENNLLVINGSIAGPNRSNIMVFK